MAAETLDRSILEGARVGMAQVKQLFDDLSNAFNPTTFATTIGAEGGGTWISTNPIYAEWILFNDLVILRFKETGTIAGTVSALTVLEPFAFNTDGVPGNDTGGCSIIEGGLEQTGHVTYRDDTNVIRARLYDGSNMAAGSGTLAFTAIFKAE